jgi:site-specific DNA recombinase
MITRDEYERVQRILGRPGRPRRKFHSFAFTGLIRCAQCGAMVTAENKQKVQKNGNVHHYVYYHCTKRKEPRCTEPSVEERDLEKQIKDYLSRIQISDRFMKWALEYLRELHREEEKNLSAINENLQRTHGNTQKALDELIRMRYLGLVDNEEYERERSRLKTELASVTEELGDPKHASDRWRIQSENTFRFACHALDRFCDGDTNTKKEILAALGSNLLLKDKILLLEARKPFMMIERGVKRLSTNLVTFEPPKFVTAQRENALSGVSIACMRGIVEEVRTFFENSDEEFYVPNFSNIKDVKEAA